MKLIKRDESLGKKIREAENLKIPVMLIVGPKDVAASTVSVRQHNEETTVPLAELKSFIEVL